ncbi:hypothetical protein ACH4GE_36665 [Streptomyces tendae]
MGRLGRWWHEREQRRLAKAQQVADRWAAELTRRRQRNQDQLEAGAAARERKRRARCDAITEEVDRRQAAGQLTPLQAAKVLRAAIARSDEHPGPLDYRHAEVMPAAIRQLVTDVMADVAGSTRVGPPRTPSTGEVVSPAGQRAEQRKARARARARDQAWAKEEARKAEQERALERESERRLQEWRQEVEDRLRNPDMYPRRRGQAEAEQEAPDLLASAGLPAGRNELRIAVRLLMRHEEVTPEQMRRAFEYFDRLYEDQVRRFKESGGKAAWPSAASLIEKLF